ncbi:MAG: thioredoxin domain-containing protein, partial [Proteobacteria bacterium]|nr:thioredoxin domain-containing protein [Pseudomonadota bacterium]
GWPASFFLMPNRVPFTAGTFIPREQFIKMLQHISKEWKNNPDTMKKIGSQVTGWLKQQQSTGFSDIELPGNEIFKSYLLQSQLTFDEKNAGFGKEMKFPRPMQLSVLLRIYRRSGDKNALELVTKTLDAMARGGIFDQIGGGFHRYATDPQWQVPHFEKMLYSNALLINNYLEAYQITRNREYAQIARETLDYVLSKMTHSGGGFYSAEDADSEKTEGKFYVWSKNELRRHLTPGEFNKIRKTYHITKTGNFNPELSIKELEERAGMKSVKNRNIFYLNAGQALPDKSDPVLESAIKKLLAIRLIRVRPGLDDKILTAWNGLMISTMSKAYRVLKEKKYLETAQKSASFILGNLRKKDGSLLRRWRQDEAQFNAYLDDYAYFIQGLLSLYQSDFDETWYQAALKLQKIQDKNFKASNSAYFYSDKDDTTLLQRSLSFSDTALPNGNGVSAINLLMLADLSLQWDLKTRAGRIISLAGDNLIRQPTGFSQLLIALDYIRDRSKEIAIIGKPNQKLFSDALGLWQDTFSPNQVIASGIPVLEEENKLIPALAAGKPMLQNQTTIYVCEDNICKLPTHDLKQMKASISEKNSYKTY